jgi:hypothetical protein
MTVARETFEALVADQKRNFAEMRTKLEKDLDELEAGKRVLAAERAEFDARRAKLEAVLGQEWF